MVDDRRIGNASKFKVTVEEEEGDKEIQEGEDGNKLMVIVDVLLSGDRVLCEWRKFKRLRGFIGNLARKVLNAKLL
jgi:hypothetical protein